MDKYEKAILILVVFTFLLRFPIYFLELPMTWDSAAYVMNAKWFGGNQIYFEDLRPPLLPLILAPFHEWDITRTVIPATFAALSVLMLFLLVRRFESEKLAFIASLLLTSNLAFIELSSAFGTEPGNVFFTLAAFYFFVKARKNERYLLPGGLFIGLAFLFRYPLGLIGITAALYYLYSIKPRTPENYVKKTALNKYIWGALLISVLVILPWFYFNLVNYNDPVYSMKRGAEVFAGDVFLFKPATLYIEHMLSLVSPLAFVFFVIGVVSKDTIKKEEYFLLLLWLVLNVVYFNLQGVKEIRYLIPVLPAAFFFSAKGIERASGRVKGKFGRLDISMLIATFLVFMNILGAVYLVYTVSTHFECLREYGVREASLYLKQVSDKEDVIYTTHWPVVAYYSERRVIGIYADINPEWVNEHIKHSDYVLYATQIYEHPITKEHLDSLPQLQYMGEFGPECTRAWLYKVKDEFKKGHE
jgi:4-amino-4-deoxy-L-arabinose transferase-like glycosyltransferase